jgi:predicted AAA+ superfamily ATPase
MGNRELAQLLRDANPWWSRQRRATWPDQDEVLLARAQHEQSAASHASERLLADLARPPVAGTVVLVAGPPAVGKTTSVRDLLRRVLADPAVDPRSVVWVPVEEVPDQVGHILAHPSLVGVPACDGDRLWVLDEVTAATGWPELLDAAPKAQVLATGSAVAPDQLEAVRAAHPEPGSVRVLRPMTLSDLLLAAPGADPAVVRADYLRGGGFPRAVAELRDTGEVSREFVDLLVRGLARGMCPNKSEPAVTSVITAVCSTTDRCVQLNRVAESLGVSLEQAEGCIDRLAALGAIDPARGLVDPLMHWLPHLVDATVPAPTIEHVATFAR